MKNLTFRRRGSQAGAPAALALAFALTACSGPLLDRLNPFGPEEPPMDPALAERLAAERALGVPGADDPWPRIASVPGEAPPVTPEDERRRIVENLAAIRDGGAPGPAVAAAPAGAPSAMVARGPRAPAPGESLHIAVIHYPHGGAALTREDKAILKRVADSQRARDVDVRVVGHASARASGGGVRAKRANFRAALDRARIVAAELARLGVPRARILIESRSENDPAWSNATPLGEAANRRADIYFVAPPDSL